LARVDDEIVVVTPARPRAGGDFAEVDEFPVRHVDRLQAEVIADGGRNVEAGAAVEVRLRAVIAKDVFPMVRAEWPAVRPLRVNDPVSLSDSDPAIAADGLAVFDVGFLEPRDYARRFGLGRAVRNVIIRQRAIKRVLSWNKPHWDVVAPRGWVGIVEPAVVLLPLRIPRAGAVRHGIVLRRLFADPEDGRHDAELPRITSSGNHRAAGRRDVNLRLYL